MQGNWKRGKHLSNLSTRKTMERDGWVKDVEEEEIELVSSVWDAEEWLLSWVRWGGVCGPYW